MESRGLPCGVVMTGVSLTQAKLLVERRDYSLLFRLLPGLVWTSKNHFPSSETTEEGGAENRRTSSRWVKLEDALMLGSLE